MTKYLAIYFGVATESEKAIAMDEKSQRDFMETWAKWAEKHKDSVIDFGSPLGRAEFINHAGVSRKKSNMTGFSIVQAESQKQAASIFLEHPHLKLHPGNSIEIMEMMSIPESSQ